MSIIFTASQTKGSSSTTRMRLGGPTGALIRQYVASIRRFRKQFLRWFPHFDLVHGMPRPTILLAIYGWFAKLPLQIVEIITRTPLSSQYGTNYYYWADW